MRKFISPQKNKPKLARICQDCRKQPAIMIAYVKWYRNAPVGSYNIRWASLCGDCHLVSYCAGDVLPKPMKGT